MSFAPRFHVTHAAKAVVLGATFALPWLPSSLFAADDAQPGELQEVVITGSRIYSANQASSSPIQVINNEDIRLQGTSDISDVINNLPANLQNASSGDYSNTTNPLHGPGGITTADLRGLGPQRTLVLVDGKRLGVGDPNTGNTNSAADLDQIPVPLIERAEVVTGGASAVYGSDAIAGVVNFIMRHNFRGVEFNAQYGFNQHKNGNPYMQNLENVAGFQTADSRTSVRDGSNRSLSLVLGTGLNDDRGNIEAYLTYRSAAPVSQGSRDFSACKLNVSSAGVGVCSGSPNSNQWVIQSGPAKGQTLMVVGNQFVPWSATTVANPPPLFNSNPYQYLSRQDTRYQAGLLADYKLNDFVQPYADFSFMNDRSEVRIGPSGLFQGGDPVTGVSLFNCNNPLLSAQQQSVVCTPAQVAAGTDVQALIGRRNVEGVGRTAYFEHINYRGVVGVKGQISDAWRYDAYGSYYYTSLYDLQDNYVSWNSAEQGLEVVNVAGAPKCKSVVAGTSTSCVPFNIFTAGAVTPDQLAFMQTYGTQYGTVKEQIASAYVTGDLGTYGARFPSAKDGISVAVGAEYRQEQMHFRADKALGSGDLSGGSGASVAINNNYNVDEYFAEVLVPIVQSRSGIQDLSTQGGYRTSNYSTDAGRVNTYKLALQYSPIRDLRLRYAYQRAIRAANIIELFNPQTVTQSALLTSDACAGATPTASFAACQRTGVTAAQYGNIPQCPAGQCAVLLGGNLHLAPEIANTYSYGITTTPSFAPGLEASIDYFRIKLDGEITTIPENIIFNDCLNNVNPAGCASIKRTAGGFLFGQTIAGGGYVSNTNVNAAVAEVSGLDYALSFKHGLPGALGSLQYTFNGGQMLSNKFTPYQGAATYDCAGLYGTSCQTVNPKWHHVLRVSWKLPANFTVSAQWRHIGSVKLETTSSEPTIGKNAVDTFEGTLKSANYLDLGGSWRIGTVWEFRAAVNNVTDRDPPLVSSLITGTGAPNTYPTYDLLGRVLSIGLTAKY